MLILSSILLIIVWVFFLMWIVLQFIISLTEERYVFAGLYSILLIYNGMQFIGFINKVL